MKASHGRIQLESRIDFVLVVAAVLLIAALPLTALIVPAHDTSWSLLDPNLVYVRSPTGSVNVDPSHLGLYVVDSRTSARVNLASLSSDTIVDLAGAFSIPARSQPVFSVLLTSPYDQSSCVLRLDPIRSVVVVASTAASGTLLSLSAVNLVSPTLPFHIRARFVPNGAFSFEVTQAALGSAFTCSNQPLASTVPVNLDLELMTSSGAASVALSSLQLTLPGASNRQYVALDWLLVGQYAAIAVLSCYGFRRQLLAGLSKFRQWTVDPRSRWRRFYARHRIAILATAFAFPIQVATMLLGSHPYDIYTEELWSYVAAHYGTASVIPISLVVPGGKAAGFVSSLGSGYPYPPLALYLFHGAGLLGSFLLPSGPVPSAPFGDIFKLIWVGFLDATAWAVYLELRRLGIKARGGEAVFLLVILNPGLLADVSVWGQFDIVVAFFVLVSFLFYGRQRPSYALFFLILAVLTKQTGLFVAAFLVPLYLMEWGPRRFLIALGRCLVGVFFVLLPLFAVGISPTYVVRVTVGDVILGAVLPGAAGVAPWQQTVTNGAFNLWPLVTAVFEGQKGLQRFTYPDFVAAPPLGVPFLVVGAGLAVAGFLWVVLEMELARRRNQLHAGAALIAVIAGFIWVFTVMTRMSPRYLSLVLPLMALVWAFPGKKRLARWLFGTTTVVSTFSLVAQLGVAAVQLPPALQVFQSSSVLALSNEFITLLCLGGVLVLTLSLVGLWEAGRRVQAGRGMPKRIDIPRMPDVPRVSLVILNYNGGELARNCVASVLADDYADKEILVVDNASTDNSLELLAEYVSASRITVVRNEANLSFARGNNRGAARATGELLLFLNNDTVIEPGSIARMVGRFRDDPSLGAAQPLVLFLPDRHLINSAGNLLDTLAFNEVLGIAQPREGFHLTGKTSYAVGAALMIRRDIFSHVGGFDEILDFYYTDADLSWKTWLAGFSVGLVPDATVYHAEGSSLRRFGSIDRLGMVIRTQLTIVAKNYHPARAISACSSVMAVYIGVATMYLIRGDLKVPRATTKAFGLFLASMPRILKARTQVTRLRTISDEIFMQQVLVPFNPISVFRRKRTGWGYLSDKEKNRLA